MNKSLFAVLATFSVALFLSACSEILPQGALGFQYDNQYVQYKFDRMVTGDIELVIINSDDFNKPGVVLRGGDLSIVFVDDSQYTAPGQSLCKRYQLRRFGSRAVEYGMLCKDAMLTHSKWIDEQSFKKLAAE